MVRLVALVTEPETVRLYKLTAPVAVIVLDVPLMVTLPAVPVKLPAALVVKLPAMVRSDVVDIVPLNVRSLNVIPVPEIVLAVPLMVNPPPLPCDGKKGFNKPAKAARFRVCMRISPGPENSTRTSAKTLQMLPTLGPFTGLRPTAINFDLFYQWVGGKWRLFGVSIAPSQIASIQPGFDAPPPQKAPVVTKPAPTKPKRN